MPISKDLFLAILSMDAYNRGYGAGLADAGADDPDGLGESGLIGKTRILARPDSIDYEAWKAAGFYAIAYEVHGVDGIANGTTVISYRGDIRA